jgi:hypothetical protein
MSAAAAAPPGLNPSNVFLEKYRITIATASRFAIVPECNPIAPSPLSPTQLRKSLLRVPITAAIMGDNFLIPTVSGAILVYEIFLWNSSAATVNMKLYQGPSASGILLLPVSNFPSETGLLLGFNGNWEQPHFEIDSGNPLVLKLSTTGPVEGFIRYRIANGTE